MRYFDFNATAPLHPAARETWLDVSDRAWHNPSSLFAAATRAREILEDARERLAELLGCVPQRIVFTRGATAANNALARHLGRSAPAGSEALISPLEHPCVTASLEDAFAGRVRELVVDRDGVVHATALENAVESSASAIGLVSVMAAGNESGVLQPWAELAALCRRHRIPFHTDAAQWLGRMPTETLGQCDWVTGSGHKFGGPKGVGFLVVPGADGSFRGDVGGPQERGRHAGTEDVAAVAAMVAALDAHARQADTARSARAADRDAAAAWLLERLPQAAVVSGGAARLWNTLAVAIPGGHGKKLVARLAAAGIAASTGSACSAGSDSTAKILTATVAGPADGNSPGLVRLSGGWETTAADWQEAVAALVSAASGDPRSLPTVRL